MGPPGGPAVNLLVDAFGWLTTAEHWWGSTGIVERTVEHVRYSIAAVVVAALIAVPAGVALGHLRRFGTTAISVGNLGRAVPTFALLFIGQQIWGLDELWFAGPITAFVALVALGLPPMLINAYTGMAGVPGGLREAAAAMGLNRPQRALQAELPVALPLVLAGVRTSATQIVATASLAAVVGAGGLGRFIIDGLSTRDYAEVMAGAFLVAALALATEALFALAERRFVSPGLRIRPAVAQPSAGD